MQKSKKAREYQILVEENELLQKRLHTQEEDFKLQNTTLMDELAKVKHLILRCDTNCDSYYYRSVKRRKN